MLDYYTPYNTVCQPLFENFFNFFGFFRKFVFTLLFSPSATAFSVLHNIIQGVDARKFPIDKIRGVCYTSIHKIDN